MSRLVYDKQEDSIFKYQIYNTDFLYQRPIYWISSINQDIANWYPFDAPELIEAYKEGKLKGRLNEIATKLNEDSNPVIMLIKYKNHFRSLISHKPQKIKVSLKADIRFQQLFQFPREVLSLPHHQQAQEN